MYDKVENADMDLIDIHDILENKMDSTKNFNDVDKVENADMDLMDMLENKIEK